MARGRRPRGGSRPRREGTAISDEGPDRIETREQLGAALNTWRLRAGLTTRQLASRAGLPNATVGGYLTGRNLPGPSQAAQFRRLFEVCGLTDEIELDGWQAALIRVRSRTDGRQSHRSPDSAPYPGLRSFEATDSDLFFGREKVLADLISRLAGLRAAAGTDPRLAFVVGASGAGKSSLLRAGLQPAVLDGVLGEDGETWSAHVLVPGTDPAGTLAESLDRTPEPRVLIVDQFEELFTQAGAESADRFVARLTGLGPRTLVVASLRADFYAGVAADPRLVPALQAGQLVIPPLTVDELRSVVVEPAAARRVPVEDALVEVVLADLMPVRRPDGAAAHQNALPLLSHALRAAWEHRVRGRLTLRHYRAAGGLDTAVQQSAEQAYGPLNDAERALARRLFLRLVAIDDDYLTTKRRLARAEVPGGAALQPVIERFVAQRLITVDEKSIEISHDALLSAWPRLAEWIAADHAGLRVHRRLTSAANAWATDGSDEQTLLRGNPLAEVAEWARDPDHRAAMNTRELEFLDRSTAARDAVQLAARRRLHLLRTLVGTLLVLVVVSGGSAGYAFRANSISAAQRRVADRARDEALSRQVAIESTRARDVDPTLAEQLALAAYRISPTVDARSALLDSAAGGIVHRLVGSSGPTMVRINPAGTVMAISNAKTGGVDLRRYTGDRPGARLGVAGPGDPGKVVFALAFSPDGDTLAVGGESGQVRLYDVRDPARPAALGVVPGGFGRAVEALAFSPDGSRLVAGGAEPSVRAWSATDWRAPRPLPIAAGTGAVQTVAFSPDGRSLAAGGADGVLRLWPSGRLGTATGSVGSASGATTINAMAWSPDSRRLVVAGKDGSAAVVDPATRAVTARLATGFSSWISSAAYAPGGTTLALGGSNNVIALFDMGTSARIATIPSAAQITAIAYAPDGAVLHVAAADGTVRTFPAEPRTISVGESPLFSLGLDRDGTRLAVSSSGTTGRVGIWSRATGTASLVGGATPVVTPTVPRWFGTSAGTVAVSPDGRSLVTGNRAGTLLMNSGSTTATLAGAAQLNESVQFSPDGRLVASASDDGFVHLWDVSAPATPRSLPALSTNGEATGVAFSPDGHFLAATSIDRRVHRWDIRDPAAARELPPLAGFGNYTLSVAFSPDSRLLAAGGADDTIRLWDLTDPGRARPVGGALTGPTDYIYSVAFSPDGRALAASGGDGTVWTWRLPAAGRPEVTTTLRAADPGGKTYAIGYLPDGTALVAVGTAGDVTFWPTGDDQVAAALCAGGGDALTAAEWAQYVPGSAYRPTCP